MTEASISVAPLPGAPAAPLGERQEPILVVEGAGKQFGELVALQGVTFSVAEGEILGIAGPNGAGKSTLFNLIAGSLHGKGSILFEGRQIMGLESHRICRQGIARTFQIPTVFASFTVEQHLHMAAHFGRRSGEDGWDPEEILAFVGLGGRAAQSVRHLNLLGKKLTMLASALATNPRLLLLDEPMGGLSPAEISQFGSLILRLNQEMGLTVVIIEHVIRKLVELSDRLMILHHGEQLALGDPLAVAGDRRVVELYFGTQDHARG